MSITYPCVLFACAFFIPPGHAQTQASHKTIGLDSTSSATVGWIAGPSGRGTWSLVWGCLVAIFASTWTVLHLNVPALHDGTWTRILRKAKWMAITVLFPEFIFAKAVCELRLALADLRDMAEWCADLKRARQLSWVEESSGLDGVLGMRWSWSVRRGRVVGLLLRLLRLTAPAGGHAEDGQNDKNQARELDVSDSIGTGGLGENEIQGARESLGSVMPEPKTTDESDEGGTGEQDEIAHPPQTQYEKVQEWTLTHSYYTNMGGLVYPYVFRHDTPAPQYFILTGQMLAHTDYTWLPSHPLHGLVLDEKDIQDGSKADWLGRGLAVVQTTWIVLNVAARAAAGLPVTQLEIATVSFSAFAVATYLANWWKPKDVSRPRLLPRPREVATSHQVTDYDRTQSFTRRLWSPVRARQSWATRVPNDRVWLQGDTPLMLILVAGCSLVFGGLHCLAWDFDFPSRTELVVWRVAAPVTALLPVIALIVSMGINYRATRLTEQMITAEFVGPLQRLEQAPEEWWREVCPPHFASWSLDRRLGFLTTVLHSLSPDQAQADCLLPSDEEDRQKLGVQLTAYMSFLSNFYSHWTAFLSDRRDDDVRLRLLTWAGYMAQTHDARVMTAMEGYQNLVRARLSTPERPIPSFSLHDRCSQAVAGWQAASDRAELLGLPYRRAALYLTLVAGIIYAAARLIIIILSFTSLRSVPEGVYADTPWTRFLPNIS